MIAVRVGDLATAPAAAILRPVSAEWNAVNPTMRRLELVAGEAMAARCRALGDLPVGSAVITEAGDLAAEYLVHVVVRSVEEPVTVAGIRRGLTNGLRRLAEWGIESVALPPLGTGAGNLDSEESAQVMVPVLLAHDRAGGPPDQIEIVVENEYEQDVFQRRLVAASP